MCKEPVTEKRLLEFRLYTMLEWTNLQKPKDQWSPAAGVGGRGVTAEEYGVPFRGDARSETVTMGTQLFKCANTPLDFTVLRVNLSGWDRSHVTLNKHVIF